MDNNLVNSVSVIFVYKSEYFVIKRQSYLKDFPGYTVFPGGKTEDSDHNSQFVHSLTDGYPPYLIHAIIREINEELNYDLEHALINNSILLFQSLGYVYFPSLTHKGYKHYYFFILLNRKESFPKTNPEFIDSFWGKKQALIDRFRSGHMLTSSIFFEILNAIERQRNKPLPPTKDIPAFKSKYSNNINVLFQPLYKLNTVPSLSYTDFGMNLYTNVLLIGDAPKKVLVDPAGINEKQTKSLIKIIKNESISSIFVSHAHIDHTKGVNIVAKHFNIPIMLSSITYKKICSKLSHDYFDGIKITFVNDGDIITSWLKQPVRAHDLSGHQAGQLGLAPDNMAWFFVADLIQSQGSVVVEDMSDYITSLKKVVCLNPDVVIPSHGMLLGGIHQLKQVLDHRLKREKQILDLYKKGKNLTQIFNEIYPRIHKNLRPLAMQNIKAHLKKITS